MFCHCLSILSKPPDEMFGRHERIKRKVISAKCCVGVLIAVIPIIALSIVTGERDRVYAPVEAVGSFCGESEIKFWLARIS